LLPFPCGYFSRNYDWDGRKGRKKTVEVTRERKFLSLGIE
jgi:hypothetical protein